MINKEIHNESYLYCKGCRENVKTDQVTSEQKSREQNSKHEAMRQACDQHDEGTVGSKPEGQWG